MTGSSRVSFPPCTAAGVYSHDTYASQYPPTATQAAEGTRVTLRLPDDFHHHGRDGSKTTTVLAHAAQRFGRCLFMPNLQPPITTTELALAYKKHVTESLPPDVNEHFQPLFVLYLTDRTTADEIHQAHAAGITGVKYYPAGATTNSEYGVSNVQNCYPALQALSDNKMMLCIHSEVARHDVDVFDREPVFVEEVIKPIVRDFPKLRITMEHISTKEAVDYITNQAPDNVCASITCHHMLYNRNHLLAGGIRPHLYCMPILKAEFHRQALVAAVTSGSPRFFAGTDSAPHVTSDKETGCGCAGVYTAHAAIEVYATVLDQVGHLDKLEDFCSSFGADHYGLPRNTATITLEKRAWTVPETYEFGGVTLTPLLAGQEIPWRIVPPSEL